MFSISPQFKSVSESELKQVRVQPTPEERFPWANDEVRYRLVSIVNPEREFFKDSGGKSHCLTTRLRLVPINGPLLKKLRSADASTPEFNQSLGRAYECDDSIKLPLKLELFYESNKICEDQSILNLMGNETPCLKLYASDDSEVGRGWFYECDIKFRLEKVSLRMDGQRVKLSVALDSSIEAIRQIRNELLVKDPSAQHPSLESWMRVVESCKTTEINVLSKKKNSQRDDRAPDLGTSQVSQNSGEPLQRGPGAPSLKRQRSSQANDDSLFSALRDMEDRLAEQIRGAVDPIERRISTLDYRLSNVHNVLMRMQRTRQDIDGEQPIVQHSIADGPSWASESVPKSMLSEIDSHASSHSHSHTEQAKQLADTNDALYGLQRLGQAATTAETAKGNISMQL